MVAQIKAISISKIKGSKKTNIKSAKLIENFGIENDVHAGSIRQISLLAIESINKMRTKLNVNPGDFAENITTENLSLINLKIGTKLKLGKDAIIEITHKGKTCHNRCEIYEQVGDCVMPSEGVFAKVIKGGKIKTQDEIKIVAN